MTKSRCSGSTILACGRSYMAGVNGEENRFEEDGTYGFEKLNGE